jgi:hypothetical protein
MACEAGTRRKLWLVARYGTLGFLGFFHSSGMRRRRAPPYYLTAGKEEPKRWERDGSH